MDSQREPSLVIMHGIPLKKHEEEEEDIESTHGCGCFRLFGLNWQPSSDHDDESLLHKKGEQIEAWWKKNLRKAREVSEILAGPKWKTFIRKVSRYCKNKKRKNRFQYDIDSYALNFDSGVDDEDALLQDSFVPNQKLHTGS